MLTYCTPSEVLPNVVTVEGIYSDFKFEQPLNQSYPPLLLCFNPVQNSTHFKFGDEPKV